MEESASEEDQQLQSRMYKLLQVLALVGVCLTSTRDEYLAFCKKYTVSPQVALRAVDAAEDFQKVASEEMKRRRGERRCFEGWSDFLRMLGNTVAIYYSRMRDRGFPKANLQAHFAWREKSWAEELLTFEKSFLHLRHRSAAHVVNGVERFLLVLKNGKFAVLETHVPVTDQLFFTFFFVISSLNNREEVDVDVLLSACRNVSSQSIKREIPECVIAGEKLRGFVLDCNYARAVELVDACLSYQAQLRDLERAHCCFKLSYYFLEFGRTKFPTAGIALSYEAFSALYRAISTGRRHTTVPGVDAFEKKEKNRFIKWRADAFHERRGPFVDYLYPCPDFDSEDPSARIHWEKEIPENISLMMEALSRKVHECCDELARLIDLAKFEEENPGYSWLESSRFALLEAPLTLAVPEEAGGDFPEEAEWNLFGD